MSRGAATDFAVTWIAAERARLEAEAARVGQRLALLAEAEAALARYLALGDGAGAPPAESGVVGGVSGAVEGSPARDAGSSTFAPWRPGGTAPG